MTPSQPEPDCGDAWAYLRRLRTLLAVVVSVLTALRLLGVI